MQNLKHWLKTHPLAKVIELISVFLAAFLIVRLFVRTESDNLLYNQVVVWIANIVMLLLVWLGLKLRDQSWDHFGLSCKNVSAKAVGRKFLLSLLVFALAMLGFLLGSVLMANITGIPAAADMTGYDYLKNNPGMLILSLVGIYIVSSFGEEVVYRGFLINRLRELFGNKRIYLTLAVVISALIFGLAHYSWGPMGIVQTTFMGLALGICYLWLNKDLWILIISHAYMDTILMLQIYMSSN